MITPHPWLYPQKGVRETAQLNSALRDLDQLTPCQSGGGLDWLSEKQGDRARAVIMCGGCPVITLCTGAAKARGDHFGVWGGVDRTRPSLQEPAADMVA